MNKNLAIIVAFLFLQFSATAGMRNGIHQWTTTNPFEEKNFIKNEGQFILPEPFSQTKIFYSARIDGVEYYFTPDGYIVRKFDKRRNTEKEIEELKKNRGIKETGEEKEEKEFKYRQVQKYFQFRFNNTNPAVEVISEEQVPEYYNYPQITPGTSGSCIRANAFKKIIYKNIYDHTDIVFEFPRDKKGIKYSVIAHPGADLSKINISFPLSGSFHLSGKGDMEINSEFGLFTDHHPESFIESSRQKISSTFLVKKNTVGFNISGWDGKETLVIDPWTSNPALVNYNDAYDVDYDNAGNVYVAGGSYPFQVKKFNPGGGLIWSASCTAFVPYIGTDAFYGDFAVDPASQSIYITEGFNNSGAKVIKLKSTGAVAATYAGSPNFTEMWRMALNKCTNQAVIVGGGVSFPTNHGCYLDTSLSSLTPVKLNGTGNTGEDIALLALDNFGGGYIVASGSNGLGPLSGNLVKLTLPGLLPVQYAVKSGYSIMELGSYKINAGVSGMSIGNGFNGIATFGTNVYTYNSYVLKKWNGTTGNLLGYKKINPPIGGIDSTTILWGGITIDGCENIYIGSKKTIQIYDSKLNLLSTIPAAETVFDLKIGLNNLLYASGHTFVSEIKLTGAPCALIDLHLTSNPAGCGTLGSAAVNPAGGTPPYTYTWLPGGQTTASVTGLAAGSYTIIVKDKSCNVLTQKDSVTIVSGGSSSVAITPSNLNCNGDKSGSATAVPGGTATPYTYSWSTTPVQNTVTATGLAAGIYTVTIKDANNCSGSSTVNITEPAILTTVASNDTIICSGANAHLSAASAGGNSGYTYTWMTGNLSGSSVTVNPASKSTYTVTVKDVKNCSAIDSVVVDIIQPLLVDVSPPQSLCGGSSATLTASASGGTSNYIYTWMPGTVNGNSIQVTPATTTIYTVTAADACSSTTGTTTISVGPDPTVAFKADTLQGCAPLCVTFTDLSTVAGGSIVKWNWDFGDNGTSTAQNPLHCYKAGGKYTVTLTTTTDQGCVKKLVINQMITVFDYPHADFTISPPTATLLNPLFNFTDISINPVTWFWNFGDPKDKTTSILQNPSHLYSDTGSYCISLNIVNAAGCPDSITRCVTVVPDWTLYVPNSFTPNGDGKNDDFGGYGTYITEYELFVFDRWGNQVFHSTSIYDRWNGRVQNGGSNETAQEDTYVWYIGITALQKKYHYVGHVSIIR